MRSRNTGHPQACATLPVSPPVMKIGMPSASRVAGLRRSLRTVVSPSRKYKAHDSNCNAMSV